MPRDRRRCLLIAIDRGREEDERLLAELRLLLSNLGIDVVDQVVQRRRVPDSSLMIGRGKAVLVKDLCKTLDVDLVVSDRPLSPRQRGSLKELLGVEVWDRPLVIMKIFEERARTSEAKLQVELARCRYELPHLRGLGHQMSRLGGGIGTRGPGETEFEIHRRKLERRIKEIDGHLGKIEKRRSVQRKRRLEAGIPVISLVGYTNSGKSTLLRRLSGDERVYVADALFATLDTAVRSVSLSGRDFIFIDTVGFIRELPPSLTAAFRTTLEEMLFSDFLLLVLDGSDPQLIDTMEIVRSMLIEIGAAGIPRAVLLNKTDLMDLDSLNSVLVRIEGAGEVVFPINALDGPVDLLIDFLCEKFKK